MSDLYLGEYAGDSVILPSETLQQHIAIFGASGSGKTVASKVIIEELAMAGVPIIAFDPQGDIASLIRVEEDDNTILEAGLSLEQRDNYANNTEVLIWTPASSKGIPISINPLKFGDIDNLDAEEKIRFFAAKAKNIASLIGYDNQSDDGKSVETVLGTVFEYAHEQCVQMENFTELIAILTDLPGHLRTLIENVSTAKLEKELIKKLSLLTMGSRKLLFETGFPADIDTLIGANSPGKTRISVIYLNTLHSQEEKEFFIANICEMLYSWMLCHPLTAGQKGLQCALYIDEVAPYLPPVKKPACKDSLMLLFKQARKYGVACMIATQNPGDVDYKSLAQVSTYCLGKLTAKQDLKKVGTRLESIPNVDTGELLTKIPGLGKGKFLLLSPDVFPKAQDIKIRWLLSKHDVITEEQLAELIPDELREKFVKPVNKKIFPIKPAKAVLEAAITPENTENITVEKTTSKSAGGEYLYAKKKIFEENLAKCLKSHLQNSLFKKNEIVSEKTFFYTPIIKVDAVYKKKKGLFKKEVDVPATIYLRHTDMHIMDSDDEAIEFFEMVAKPLDKIAGLDSSYTLASISKQDLEYDFRQLKKQHSSAEIARYLEKKYNMEVVSSTYVFIPVWQCTISHKADKTSRIVCLEAVDGKEIKLN